MSDAVVLEPLAKLARHVGWTVIAQQPWSMQNLDLVQTWPPQRHLQRIGHVGCRHGGAQLPGQDVAREVIEHSREIEPAPADDLQIGEVIPGPQIHDSWALPQWGRVRFNTANRGGSSCRLRYHYARILMRRSCGVWPGEAKMALKPDGFWRLRRSMTVRRAPRRPRSAAWGFRSSGTGCCASTLAGLTLS